MKKTLLYTFVMLLMGQIAWAQSLGPVQSSNAYKQYQNRSSSELSKLIFLLDRFNAPGVEMRIEGNVYTSDKAFPYSKGYLAKNYKKEKAEDWIRQHCYRSTGNNEIIYMRVDGGDFKPARDVLIEELKGLESLKK